SMAIGFGNARAALLKNGSVFLVNGNGNQAAVYAPVHDGGTCNDVYDCISGICEDGICCSGPCSGVCMTGAPGTGACVGVVSADDPNTCSGPSTCDAHGVCKLKQGQTCTSADACVTGFCVDGNCCNSECGDPCDACNISTPGICSPMAPGSMGSP